MAHPSFEIIKAARPTQWVKNLALFAALVFSGNLFVDSLFLRVVWALFIFCLASSATYLFNDVADRATDRQHPLKRQRPIARGTISVELALFLATTLSFISLYLASFVSFFFFLTLLSYLILQILYSMVLKRLIVFDILAIAAGFIFRVYAGAFVINAHLSVWFLLCVVSLSLFLASGKRRAELTLGRSIYKPEVLDSYLAMFGNAAWVSWALFTFFEPPPPIGAVLPIIYDLPLALAGVSKWLMITIPIVIFGIMRYLKIIYEGFGAATPERVLWRDKQLLGAVAVWGILVIAVIYGPAQIR